MGHGGSVAVGCGPRGADAGGKVPALALTAFARAEDRELALRTGFDDYITKPIDSTGLVQAVAGLAGRGVR